jgi:hypothetical protein
MRNTLLSLFASILIPAVADAYTAHLTWEPAAPGMQYVIEHEIDGVKTKSAPVVGMDFGTQRVFDLPSMPAAKNVTYRVYAQDGTLTSAPSNSIIIAALGTPPAAGYREPAKGTFAEVTDGGAVNGRTLQTTGLTSSTTITINVQEAGTFYMWAHAYYPGAAGSNKANSWAVSVDGGASKTLGNSLDHFGRWHWAGDGVIERGTPKALSLGNLTVGAHTITIKARESSTDAQPKLDAIYLSKTTQIPTLADARLALEEPPNVTTTMTSPATTIVGPPVTLTPTCAETITEIRALLTLLESCR